MAGLAKAFVKIFYKPVEAFRDLEGTPLLLVLGIFLPLLFIGGYVSPPWFTDPRLASVRGMFSWADDPKVRGAVILAVTLAYSFSSAILGHAVAVIAEGKGSFRRFWTATLLVSTVSSAANILCHKMGGPHACVWLLLAWGLSMRIVSLSVIYEFSGGKAFLVVVGAWLLEIVLMAIFGLALGLCFYIKFRGKLGEKPATMDVTTLPAEYDWKVRSLDGREHDMSEAKGKTVVLNFWATWCGPCRAEMPSLQDLYGKVKGDGVQFYLVSDEDPAKVKAFAEKEGYSMPVYTSSGHPPVYDTQGIPATFILSPGGRIMRRQVGMWDWSSKEVLRFVQGVEKDLTPPAPVAADWPVLGSFHVVSSTGTFQAVTASFDGVCRSSAGVVAVSFSSGEVEMTKTAVERKRLPTSVRVGLARDSSDGLGWSTGATIKAYDLDGLRAGEKRSLGPKTVLVPVSEHLAPLPDQRIIVLVDDVDADHPENRGTGGSTNLRGPKMSALSQK